ncbi:tyrosine-type recombinase/integrase [Sphingomonas crocodyli]|uniref:Site-specific integrase n=1 Tax=Sphingomonas crocodyli TaxID=1979270 RepID=A0A437M5T2_9SPHN|nr:site-specific integrase [Sphingomonas crocodyli]RVT92999.1 site-specific integrase [Sphingomonas crocodyli]
MSRGLNRLTARGVAALKMPGRHADGGGLYFRVTAKGARSWVFMTGTAQKRVEIGLGGLASVSLAAARQIASDMREAAALGKDPRVVITSMKAKTECATPKFGKFAEDYISSVEAGWKSAVHRQQWRSTLRDHAGILHDRLVNEISTDNVLAVLKPIWLSKAETARRLRARIEKILDAAKARGFRSRDELNPAAWRGHLELLLPSQSKLQRGHHAALPWREAPAFMRELRARPAQAARCLEFVILTAARSGEALGATWGEVDLDARLWLVPATRMKAGAEHVVPLSERACKILLDLRPAKPAMGDLIFHVAGAARSNMAMAMLLRRMGHGGITTHGFRSTFRDWAGDATNYPREIVEQALAHTISNKAERAYRRGTAIERRREIMNSWSAYLESGASALPLAEVD